MGKSFEYYRYRVAEFLHKIVNFIMFTPATDFGIAAEIDSDCIARIKSVAERENVDFEHLLDDEITHQKAKCMESIIYTLESDGYLEQSVEHKADGCIVIETRLQMIGVKAISILKDQVGKGV